MCLLLSGALAFSLRRYFPSFYSEFSINSLSADLVVAGLGMFSAIKYASNVIQ